MRIGAGPALRGRHVRGRGLVMLVGGCAPAREQRAGPRVSGAEEQRVIDGEPRPVALVVTVADK